MVAIFWKGKRKQMKIPARIKRKTKTHDRQIKYYEYRFIKKYNNNLFLYERTDNNTRECFTLYDLKMINNDYIDKKIHSNKEYKVLNTETSETKIYKTIVEIAKELNTTASEISNYYCHQKLLFNKYLIDT